MSLDKIKILIAGARLIKGGRLFQSFGPAVAKAIFKFNSRDFE